MSARPAGFGTIKPHPGYGPFEAVVQAVIDGDTIDLMVDVGFRQYLCTRFRLKASGNRGVDAPEMHGRSKKRGAAAKAWMTEFLPVGSSVTLSTQKDPDLYGRYFAEIDKPGAGDVGSALVAAGHAVWREWS